MESPLQKIKKNEKVKTKIALANQDLNVEQEKKRNVVRQAMATKLRKEFKVQKLESEKRDNQLANDMRTLLQTITDTKTDEKRRKQKIFMEFSTKRSSRRPMTAPSALSWSYKNLSVSTSTRLYLQVNFKHRWSGFGTQKTEIAFKNDDDLRFGSDQFRRRLFVRASCSANGEDASPPASPNINDCYW